MKKYYLLIILLVLLGCSKSQKEKEEEIKSRIKSYYLIGEVKNFEPISFGTMDTTYVYDYMDRIEGRIQFKFRAQSKNGQIGVYEHYFLVTIAENNVVVLPEDESIFIGD